MLTLIDCLNIMSDINDSNDFESFFSNGTMIIQDKNVHILREKEDYNGS